MIDRAYDLHLAGYPDVSACDGCDGRSRQIVVPGLTVSGRVPGAFMPIRWPWLDAVVEDDDDGE